MPGNKYLTQTAGDLAEARASQTSAGAADAGKIPALDGTGRLDNSLMPTGIGADTALIVASEALAAGDFVNVWISTGFKVRKADAAGGIGKRAHGYVTAAVASAGMATVFFEGRNNQVAGMTAGDVYLSNTVPGGATATAPTAGGSIAQQIGVAVSATEINVEFEAPILLVA